jgi:hypothetical protein
VALVFRPRDAVREGVGKVAVVVEQRDAAVLDPAATMFSANTENRPSDVRL